LGAGFEGLERIPSMFVLLGSFQSYACASASTDYGAVKDNFAALADALEGFSRIKVRARRWRLSLHHPQSIKRAAGFDALFRLLAHQAAFVRLEAVFLTSGERRP
jgi:hypothetical protein